MKLSRNVGVGLLCIASLALLDGPPFALAVPNRKSPCDKLSEGVDWNTTRRPFEWKGSMKTELEWIAKEAKMSLHFDVPLPRGTICMVNPKSHEYTLTEIFDIINRRLQGQAGITLIRGETTLTVVSVDDDAKGTWMIPRVRAEDLPIRGQTEIVEVVVKLSPKEADDVFDLQRLLGDFGRVTPLVDNHFVVRSNVATLRRTLFSPP